MVRLIPFWSTNFERLIRSSSSPFTISGIDNRLRIELLRAHLPAKFKTPGSGAAVAVNAPGASVLVMTPEVQAELMAMRQESLRAIEEKKAKAIEVSK